MILIAAIAILSGESPLAVFSRSFLSDDKSGYMIMPPTTVCDGEATRSFWSSDGANLAVIRKVSSVTAKDYDRFFNKGAKPSAAALAETSELWIWSDSSNLSQRRLKLAVPARDIHQILWLKNTSSMLVTLASDQPGAEKVCLVSSSGSIVTVLDGSMSSAMYIRPSPTQSSALIEVQDLFAKTHSLYVFQNGQLSAPIPVPTTYNGLFWTPDGKGIVGLHRNQSSNKTEVLQLDRMSGTFNLLPDDGHLKKTIEALNPDPPTLLRAVESQTSINNVEVDKVLLYGTDKLKGTPAIISTDATNPELSPMGNAVAYTHQGTCMVRQIIQIPLEAYQKARNGALQTEAMTNAKQVGIALAMLAADYDDAFPENGNWQEKLYPYTKDKALMSSFNYTYAGGTPKDPANTELGFSNGPGGRAVVYADGHTVWVPN